MIEEPRPEANENDRVSLASTSRRNFLKKSALAGAAVTALYVAPNMSSITARPAYASITGPTAAPTCVETKLTASDAATYDGFGHATAISGDFAIVGAESHSDAGNHSGAAYIFHRNAGGADNWGEIKQLTASDAAADDFFGFSVAIHGNTAIVGAFNNSDAGTGSGSAYIFSKDEGGPNNWGEVKKLNASDAASGDEFGSAVSISGRLAIVGAPRHDNTAGITGAAYIFNRREGGANNWGEIKKLVVSSGRGFGSSVSISGGTAIVGLPRALSAYIFDRNKGGFANWGEVKKLTALDEAWGDAFGLAVSISGSFAIVGAHRHDDTATDSGAAYIFDRDLGGISNWGQEKKLLASDAAAGDEFGVSVAISGDKVIVGAGSNDDAGTNSGSAYVFRKDEGGTANWGEVRKLTASDAAAGDIYGQNVSISGNTAIAGAVGHADAVPDSGTAYICQNLV